MEDHMADRNSSKDSNSSSSSKKDKRVIGEGMTSLDSTQAPLKADTGLPDYDAMTKKGKSSDSSSKDSGRSNR
jgi:hypothetical protein